MPWEDMLIGGYVKRIPSSLMSKGEKIEELFPSIPKGENVEYGFHWFQKSSLMTKEMTWHVWWCDMCDEVSNYYDDVLVLSWSHFYNLTPFYKNMETCWNYENWLSIGKSEFINDKEITKEVATWHVACVMRLKIHMMVL